MLLNIQFEDPFAPNKMPRNTMFTSCFMGYLSVHFSIGLSFLNIGNRKEARAGIRSSKYRKGKTCSLWTTQF